MLTITEVLQKCKALNVFVSKRRLIHFQKLGLLPRGEYVAGHRWVHYFPEDVVQQVLAIEVFIHRRRALVASPLEYGARRADSETDGEIPEETDYQAIAAGILALA